MIVLQAFAASSFDHEIMDLGSLPLQTPHTLMF